MILRDAPVQITCGRHWSAPMTAGSRGKTPRMAKVGSSRGSPERDDVQAPAKSDRGIPGPSGPSSASAAFVLANASLTE